jgi:transposase-like protein
VHAVAVNRDGFRGSLWLDVVTSEDGAAWLAFLRSLVARGAAAPTWSAVDSPPARCAAREQQDEWAVCRRDMSVESITKALNAPQSTDQQALAIPSAA